MSQPDCCPSCGRTFDDARRTGRLGCTGCWDAFRPWMRDVLRHLQGAELQPVTPSLMRQTQAMRKLELEENLRNALGREDYIEAGRLRNLLQDQSGFEG